MSVGAVSAGSVSSVESLELEESVVELELLVVDLVDDVEVEVDVGRSDRSGDVCAAEDRLELRSSNMELAEAELVAVRVTVLEAVSRDEVSESVVVVTSIVIS